MTTTKTTMTCTKCGGSGLLRHFMNIDNGRCFRCAGSGVEEISTATDRATRTRTHALGWPV